MEQKTILMLADAPGSEDGVTVKTYQAGETYSVGAALAKTFIDCDLAELAGEEETPESLASLTVPQLKELAAAEGIDLGDAGKKAEIVEAIEKARAALAAGA